MSFWEGYSGWQQLNLSVLLFTSQTTMNVLQQVYSIHYIVYKLMSMRLMAQYDVQ